MAGQLSPDGLQRWDGSKWVPKPSPVDLSARLQREVDGYVKLGFRVTGQTSTTAELVRAKHFNWFVAFVPAITCVGAIWTVSYVFWYRSQGDRTIHLTVDEWGTLQRT